MSAPASRTKKHNPRPVRQMLGEYALLVVRAFLWVAFTAAGTALNMWAAVVLLMLFTPSSFWGYLAMGFAAGMAGGVGGSITGFGLVQRPVLGYMCRHALLWVPVNVIAAVLGAMSVLAAYDVSGGQRDTLHFSYAGLVYAVAVGVAFVWMTRQTRKAMSNRLRAGPRPVIDTTFRVLS